VKSTADDDDDDDSHYEVRRDFISILVSISGKGERSCFQL
jgi:hypothetical protein